MNPRTSDGISWGRCQNRKEELNITLKESKLKDVIESAKRSLEDLGLEGLSERDKPVKLTTGIASLDDLLSRGERERLGFFLASRPSSNEAEAIPGAKDDDPGGKMPKPGS